MGIIFVGVFFIGLFFGATFIVEEVVPWLKGRFS